MRAPSSQKMNVPNKFVVCFCRYDHDLPRNEYKLSVDEFLLCKFIVDEIVCAFNHTYKILVDRRTASSTIFARQHENRVALTLL